MRNGECMFFFTLFLEYRVEISVSCCFFCLPLSLETELPCGFRFMALQSYLSGCWDYRSVPARLAMMFCLSREWLFPLGLCPQTIKLALLWFPGLC